MNILYQKGNKLLYTWGFNFGLYEMLRNAGDQKVIYLVAPSNGFKLLALPRDPHHHG